MKSIRTLALVTGACCALLPAAARAHPGRLDSRGGHMDQRTGVYHYHRPGGRSPVARPVYPLGARVTGTRKRPVVYVLVGARSRRGSRSSGRRTSRTYTRSRR